ncbi:phenylacetate-CoA oxygenase subunit PaaJ, partial [Escherichia coli]|uniref:1,2-phenylacetyl-CoA epoxidase subunit PaaD n=1 Tax=Escherichia coli TaxID=562 RepID=UPI00211A22F1
LVFLFIKSPVLCCGENITFHQVAKFSVPLQTEHLIGAIREAMTTHGFTPVQVVLQLDPAWTTDWMTPDARERLRQYGISPPAGHSCHAHLPPEVRCPRCASVHTTLISEFGSTACKALYRCDSCREPFDYFKCI